MSAWISLLELLMHSTSHKKFLMKILSEAHMEQGISLNKIVGNIVSNNYLTFTDDEIPTEGRRHNKALHVSVKCLDHVIAGVLVDNGSSLNVMPKATLEKLPCDGMHMKSSSMIVRAFDGSKREVMGAVLPSWISSRPIVLYWAWIHSAGVVPSTLHQKLKYVMGDKFVIVLGEEDLLVSGLLSHRDTVTLKPGEVPVSNEEINRREWNRLGTYPAPTNIVVEREFYANAKHISNDDIPFLSYVRELGTTTCEYAQLLVEEVDYEAIERVLCRPRGTFRGNKQGQPIHLIRSNLTVVSQMWMTLIFSNISPSSHREVICYFCTSMSRALILYSIVARKTLNLGTLIAEEIRQCAHAYCDPNDNGPVAPPPPLPSRQRAQPKPSFDLLPYLASIHRDQLATSRMLRELTYAMPELNMMMSAAEFDEYVACPGDQSHSTREGGATVDDDTNEKEEEEEDNDYEESDDNISKGEFWNSAVELPLGYRLSGDDTDVANLILLAAFQRAERSTTTF
ncbi:hypothetical protein V8G54_029585 [Vigna mungo]|uniref:Putative plant transposon protein domain-containing protein n=1 Tax=Vigna mungo TaxID=3915 RepID=A0AAQ3MTQ3_VIGMU